MKRDLAKEASDLAAGRKVEAALPRRLGYRRVSTHWLAEVAQALRDANCVKPPQIHKWPGSIGG